jgi:hypothetical protein
MTRTKRMVTVDVPADLRFLVERVTRIELALSAWESVRRAQPGCSAASQGRVPLAASYRDSPQTTARSDAAGTALDRMAPHCRAQPPGNLAPDEPVVALFFGSVGDHGRYRERIR